MAQWVSIIQAVVLTLASVLGWSLWKAYRTGRWVQTTDAYAKTIQQLSDRLDDVAGEVATLTHQMTAVPDRMRDEREEFIESHLGPVRDGLVRVKSDIADLKLLVGTLRVVDDERNIQNQRDHARYEHQLNRIEKR